MKMSDQAQVQIGAISTGSLVLDVALGIGDCRAASSRSSG
jgi:RecA/RadA recombinase